MKFIHTADIHWGMIPDSDKPWGKKREQAIRLTFQGIIEDARDSRADLLLISGDLFHRQPLARDLKEVNYLFSTIPGTRVVIIAGNHDRIRKSSALLSFTWAPNVTFLMDEDLSSVYFEELNTEVYGGPIMYTWFDRPLSMAGRVMVKSDKPLKPATQFINFDRPLLEIPHIAIHFNRAVNDQGNPLSKQRDMLPVIAMINETFEKDNFLLKLIAQEMNIPAEDILDFDLTLYEYGKGTLFGLNNEFISSGRLDDLAMVHAGLTALLDSKPCNKTKVLAIFDNEEVGSGTKQGAASPILRTILERVAFNQGYKIEELYRAIHNSFMISADMAHALHPNYPEKHDPTNHPIMNQGPVIKINANQKYITDGDSAAVFATICKMAGVPYQTFVNHSDMAGGSTLGNILLTQMEMRGVDIGNPMWAMHSVRETAGVLDQDYVIKAFTTFYNI